MIAYGPPALRCGRMVGLNRWLFRSPGMARNTYKYHFKIRNRIVHTGITNDLDRREQEHKSTFGQRAKSQRLDAQPHWMPR